MVGSVSWRRHSRIHSAARKHSARSRAPAPPSAASLSESPREPAASNLEGILDPQPDSDPRPLAPAPGPAPEAEAAASLGPAPWPWESPSGRPAAPATQPEWRGLCARSPAPPPN